jgi:hypothetical protein
MIKFLLFLSCSIFTVSASSSLDSLVKTSEVSVQRAENVRGFFFNRRHQENADKSENRHRGGFVGPINNDNTYILTQLATLQAEQAKTSVILENLQKQSNDHTDNSEFNLKLIELLLGAFTTIVLAFVGNWVKKKTKKSSE